MKVSVNATRMQLQRLRKRLVLAKRGHKLLKDKQDELMRQFMEMVQSIRELRETVEDHLKSAFRSFTLARSAMSPWELEEALAFPAMVLQLSVKQKNIMSVKVPELKPEVTGKMRCYGFMKTSGDLDLSLSALGMVIREMLELAQAEKTMRLLADEIDKTRRRVNALEYTLIPQLEETIKFIIMKLGEMERSNLTRLMKVKDMLKDRE